MRDIRVDRFNFIVGNPPAGDKVAVLKQIANQCKFLLEEVSETLKAAEGNDIVEVVDGIADVEYVAAYLKTLVQSLGVDQHGAFLAVCDNNDQKFTQDLEVACDWQNQKDFDTYISHVNYRGEDFYTVRRDDGTGKVVKHDNFPKVDLLPFIPKELLND